jgi:hypothetical protein
VDNKVYWETDEPGVFLIGNRRVSIKKRGRAQAEQIEGLNRWLKEHIAPLTQAVKSASENAVGLDAIVSMMGQLTAEAQMDLSKVVLGNKDTDGKVLDDSFFDEYYDIDWVIAALKVAGLADSAQRVFTAFFTSAA